MPRLVAVVTFALAAFLFHPFSIGNCQGLILAMSRSGHRVDVQRRSRNAGVEKFNRTSKSQPTTSRAGVVKGSNKRKSKSSLVVKPPEELSRRGSGEEKRNA
jgi:hypothetical protein